MNEIGTGDRIRAANQPRGEQPARAGASVAFRDAAEIVARADADQAEADRARNRFRSQPMPTLEPDARIASLLGDGELVVAVRRSALLDRRQPGPAERHRPGSAATST